MGPADGRFLWPWQMLKNLQELQRFGFYRGIFTFIYIRTPARFYPLPPSRRERRGIALATLAPLFFIYSGTRFVTACKCDCGGDVANRAEGWLHHNRDCMCRCARAQRVCNTNSR
jgi:hypothetical protein